MGVHGLWKLIEPSGKPVPVESLENKVLAVDVSIWLHQLMKGYQTPAGASVSNAYLLGLFSRVCKLLFTNVKPVFVFDGGVPQLKKKTIAARQQQKSKSVQASEKLREQLLKNLLKQKAVSQVLEEIRGQTSPKKKAPDMFELPPLPQEDSASEVEEMSESSEEDVKPVKMKYKDLHCVDVKSAEFRSLPADMRHDILTELKETRKQSSWGRIHEMPEESTDFSKYQMSRLLKRRSVQVSLEEAEKEMGGRTLSLHDVEALMAEGGIEINPQLGKRIASDDVTRFIYVRESDKQSQIPTGENSTQSENIRKEENSQEPKSVSNVKIKEEIISSDELSDSEILKEVEAIETIHRIKEETENVANREENNEFATEDIFENDSSSEETFLNDVNVILKENRGLSQEQILAIIRDQNRDKINQIDPNAPSTSKEGISTEEGSSAQDLEVEDKTASKNSASTTNPQEKASDMLYFKMMDRMYGFKNKMKKGKNSSAKRGAKVNKSFVPNLATGKRRPSDSKPADLSSLASNTSDSDRDSDHNLPCNVSKMVSPNMASISLFKKRPESKLNTVEEHTATNGANKVAELSSSESDNDFVEVSPSKQMDESVNDTKETVAGISIEIQPNTGPIENDIFADIFSQENKEPVSLEKKMNYRILIEEPTELQIKINPTKSSIDDDIFVDVLTENKSRNKANMDFKNVDKIDNKSIGGTNVDTLSITQKKSNQENIREKNSESEESSDDMLPVTEDQEVASKAEEETALPDKSTEYKDDNQSETQDKGEKEKDNSLTFPSDNPQELEDSEVVDDPAPREETPSTSVEKPKRKLNMKQLEKLQEILETKEQEIVLDQNKEDRMATSMTDQMYQEAQELLRLFGVPYVVAPMEAEAQCAFMDLMGLTQGSITDDSDIWLFGGRTVYKNFFDQKKFVLEFKADNINHFFKLNRNGLVLLALLVGSDYTEGLAGVGPVTALEILSTFPPPQGNTRDCGELLASLLQFKRWWESSAPGHQQLAKKLRNIDLHQGFPSQAVVSAYLQPRVDESREPFSWGSPDLPGLRDYAERRFGWSRSRTDQILQPVINRLSQKSSVVFENGGFLRLHISWVKVNKMKPF
ncbi:DNA excision repair protein ERCC-5-like [Macrosteles quadrilineatus]|uniref:DNA excision repair protein ERCC-5-like n=1 Tax=Macrosteles quadrilineatus TaxID=74068 RepID=UPI0023E1FC69|nr:DNA excision repair protein ERCC-5-like [Macrosteles quadrilineatus]